MSVRPKNDITTTGVVTQVVYVSKTVTMRGGYTTTNWNVSYPITQPTTLDAQGQGRVMYITGSISPTAEGLRLTNGNATWLVGGMGGGVYDISATVSFSNNQVFNNVGAVEGGGLYLLHGDGQVSNNLIVSNTNSGLSFHHSDATISGNRIMSNTALGDGGGGLWSMYSNITFTGNVVVSNTANWRGGGLWLYESTATLNGNTVTSNTALHDGGGIYLASSDTTLTSNTVSANTAGTYGGGILSYSGNTILNSNSIISNSSNSEGGGLCMFGNANATISDNSITFNTAGSGGGVYLDGNAKVNGNIISNNKATLIGGGLLLWSAVALDSNIIISNTANSGGGLYLWGSNAIFTNNVVANNQANATGSGIYIRGSSPKLLHTTVAHNTGGDGSGIYIDGGNVALTNTILVSHTVGIALATGTAILETTLWGNGPWANQRDWDGAGTLITGPHNYWGDPAFIDPINGNYHIGPGSAAIDTGVDAGVYDDIDGDIRPLYSGYDIGADEFPYPPAASFTSSSPDWVGQGTVFTNTTVVTSAVVSYQWSFGDGAFSTAVSPTHAYTAPGVYTTTLTATNPAGSSVATDTVTFYAAAFTSNSPVLFGQASVFTNTTATSGTATFLWSFGDGTFGSTLENPTHTYSISGTLTVVLTATNFAGSGVVTGTVVVDGIAPTGAITINEGALYAVSPNVTLSLAANDDLSGVSAMAFSDDGVSFTPFEPYTTTRIWTLTAGDGLKGVYARFRDAVGNVSAVSDTITLDTTPPDGSIVINSGATYAASPTITLTLSASDVASGMSQMQFSGDGTSWSGWDPYATTKAWILTSGDGLKTVYVRYGDNAGITSIFSDTITLDMTPPQVSATPTGTVGNAGWWRSAVQVTLAASDATSGVDHTEYRIDGMAWQTYTAPFTVSVDGTRTVEYWSVDVASNREVTASLELRIDATPPGTAATLTGTLGNGGWYISEAQVGLSASDSTSGADVTRYQLNGGVWQTYSSTFFLQDGLYTITYQSLDVAGNQEPLHNLAVNVDTTPPTAAVSPLNAYGATTIFTVTWSGTDATSGLTSFDVQYRAGAGGAWTDWLTNTTAISASFTGQDGQTYAFRARARDNAGNGSAYSLGDTQTTVDTSPPTGNVQIDGGATYSPVPTVMLTLAASDATSGISNVQASNDGVSFSAWETYTMLKGWTLTSGDGLKTIYVRFRDAAGNVSAIYSDTIILDMTAPTDTIQINDGAIYTAIPTVTLTLDAHDVNGVATMRFSNDGVTFSAWLPYGLTHIWQLADGDGVHTAYVQYRDAAENISQAYVDTIILDVTPPSVMVNVLAPYQTALTFTVIWSGTDATSGLASYDVQYYQSGSDPIWLDWLTNTTTTSASFTGQDDYTYAFRVRARDNAGNVSAYSSGDVHTAVDVTPPTGSLTINGGALSTTAINVTLGLAAVDVTSGVAMMSFSNDGSVWSEWQTYATSANWSLPSGNGVKTVYARFRDVAGNISSPVSNTIALDTAAGTEYGVTINDGVLFTNQTAVTLTISARPGTTQMQVSNDGGFAGAQWEPYTSRKAWAITQYGSYVIPRVVYVRYKDLDGNVSSNYQDDIILDVTPPTGSVQIISATGLQAKASTVTLKLSASDDVSGVGHMLISNQPDFAGASWEAYVTRRAWTLGSDTAVYVRFRDNAGNVSSTYSTSQWKVFLPLIVK